MSTGNTVATDQVGTNGFCLSMTSSKVSGKTWYYDSLNGGLASACGTSGY
jgi:hypothetical protein